MKRASKEYVKLIDGEGIKRGLKSSNHSREIMWGEFFIWLDCVFCIGAYNWKEFQHRNPGFSLLKNLLNNLVEKVWNMKKWEN